MSTKGSSTCSISVGRGNVMLYSADLDFKPFIHATKADFNTTNTVSSRFGIAFCNKQNSGESCQASCPDTLNLSRNK